MAHFSTQKGLSESIVREISAQKKEPAWMLEFRLVALEQFFKKLLPNWGPDLSALDPYDLFYYVRSMDETQKSWDTVPDKIKKTFDALGVPEAEKKYLAGVGAQY